MTRLPQLEQELVAAAARLRGPRRVVAPAVRVAIAAAGAGLAVLAVALLMAGGGDPAREAAGQGAVRPGAQLEDMLGIFREPATAEDAMGDVGPINNRQLGEDPSRSRRVDWPGETIFMWPTRDGVCYGVPGGGGCTTLAHLGREGVSVAIHDAPGSNSLSGPVVDGIDEVVYTGPDGAETSVTVRDNFFFVDLQGETAQRVSWSYAGEELSFDVGRFLRRTPGPGPASGPDPRIEPLAESASEPLDFVAGGISYTAVGYHDTRSLVCVRLTESDADMMAGDGCLNERIVRDELSEKPAHVFSGGGVRGDPEALMQTGYAREDVVEVRPRDPASDVTVALSEPWRPGPWEGEPIRFMLVFVRGAGPPEPGMWPRVELEAKLEDGTVLPIR
jgi:hypothetical protein